LPHRPVPCVLPWQIACYGALDVLAKVVFGFLILLWAQPIISRVHGEERER
jgi:bacteriorhodopsin